MSSRKPRSRLIDAAIILRVCELIFKANPTNATLARLVDAYGVFDSELKKVHSANNGLITEIVEANTHGTPKT
jgi:hypothetical protein